MYKKGMRRAAALLAVCWLGLLFRAAAETPAEKLERLRAEQQAIEQQIEQNRTDAARAGDLVNLYTCLLYTSRFFNNGKPALRASAAKFF